MKHSACASPMLAAAALLAACQPSHPPHRPMGDTNPQGELARSLAIVRHSTSDQPKTLKLLFYGQSISTPKWTDFTVAHLKATYPNTRFIFRNMAIGGFASHRLERTVDRDLAEFYPDLVVFHVYGDHRAYERIIRSIRSKTASEVIVQTDHVTEPLEPLCDEGFHLTLHAPPGCRGFIRYRQNSWEEHMSSDVIPRLAKQYGLAIEPRRWAWNAYLERYHLPFAALLADPPHPNARGWRLMASLFDTWFDWLVRSGSDQPQNLIIDQSPPVDGASMGVTGNRIELISSVPLDGKVGVMVDGKRPVDIDGCWQTSRTSPLSNVPDWPALRQVTVDPADHQAERWTTVITDLSPAQDDFTFRLFGSRTGFDGEGRGARNFVSKSGKVRIVGGDQDWSLPIAMTYKHVGVAEGFRVTWERHFVCADEPAVALTAARQEIRHVVATGLPNGPHRVTLRFAPGARQFVTSLRSYRPPLAN